MTDEKKDKLELGDVVVLKSGGPRMTVAQEKSTSNLWCMYFVGGDLKGNDFTPETLRSANSADQP